MHDNFNNYSGVKEIVSNTNNTTSATTTTATNAMNASSRYHSSVSVLNRREESSPKTTTTKMNMASDNSLQPPVSTPDLRLIQLRVMCRQRGLDPNGSELELLKRLNEAANSTIANTSSESVIGYGSIRTGSGGGLYMSSNHDMNEEDQRPQYAHNEDTIEYDHVEGDNNDIYVDGDYDHRDDDDYGHDPLRIIDAADDDASSDDSNGDVHDDGNGHSIEDVFDLHEEELFEVDGVYYAEDDDLVGGDDNDNDI